MVTDGTVKVINMAGFKQKGVKPKVFSVCLQLSQVTGLLQGLV